MHGNRLFYCTLLTVFTATVGCQSWQGGGFPVQNATRVPPPGTGTYQLPTGYYNNTNASTSALAPAGRTLQASNDAASSLRTASGPLPTTNLTANNSSANNSFQPGNPLAGGVVPAAFQSEAPDQSMGSPASFSDSRSGGASASLSDTPSTEAPSLQWQQFGGH